MSEEFKTYTMRGKVKFPKFTKPYKYDSDLNKFVEDWTDGSFGATLEFEPELAQPEMEKLAAIQAEYKQELIKSKKFPATLEILESNYPYKDTEDKEGNKNGNVDFVFKRKVINKKGDKVNISYVDSLKQPISNEALAKVGNGSLVKINYCIYPWSLKIKDPITKKEYVNFGISLCMLAVQIIKLEKRDADLDCFDVEESDTEENPFDSSPDTDDPGF